MTTSSTELSQQVLVGFYEPGLGRPIQAGKFVQPGVAKGIGCLTEARWVYQNNVGPDDLMEVLDAWGVAPCVLDAMIKHGVDEIHYWCEEDQMTYVARPDRVLAEGIRQAHGKRGTYVHLPRASWDKHAGRIAYYPWASKLLTLAWIEPEKIGTGTEREKAAGPEGLQLSLGLSLTE